MVVPWRLATGDEDGGGGVSQAGDPGSRSVAYYGYHSIGPLLHIGQVSGSTLGQVSRGNSKAGFQGQL